MAWTNTAAQSGNTNRPQPKYGCTDWLLYCFEQEICKDVWLRMRCKLSGGKNKDGSYKQGQQITVMCRIANPDDKTPLCEIQERDYSRSWIHVDGRISCSDYKKKDGTTGTDLTIWADKVTADS